MNKKLQVLVDCDPGADDFFALLWLLINHKFSDANLEIVWITTVWWNVSASITYENVFRVFNILGIKDIAVWKDHHQIKSEDASHIHWKDGIWNLSKMLPKVSLPKKENDSVEIITNAIKKYGDNLIILTMWPLTNLALTEKKNPGILKKAKKIISMWWAINIEWNITSSAEFNIFYDSKSAKKVFSSTDNIVLIPLDLTTSMIFKIEDLENCFVEINNSKKQKFIRELTKFIIGTNLKFRETKYQKWFYIHDAHTVWFLLYPHLYSWSFMQVDIETKWEYTNGQTVAEKRNKIVNSPNCFVVKKAEKEKFLDSFTEDFKKFDFS